MNRATPRISLVTPCLNDAARLPHALRSIHAQRYPALEHIVIDGGSSDESREIISSYSERLAYWSSEPDDGHADALWKGFQHATGDIVSWVCSSDLLLPGSLQTVARYFDENPDRMWAVGDGVVMDDALKVIARIWGLPFSRNSLMYWLPWGACQPSVFMRREAYEIVGGVDRNRNLSVDTDLFLRLAKRWRPGKINGFVAALRFHSDSQSTQCADAMRMADEEIRIEQGLVPLPEPARRWVYRCYDWRFRAYQVYNERTRRSKLFEVGKPLLPIHSSSVSSWHSPP